MPETTNAISTPEEEMARLWEQSQLAARRMLKRKEEVGIVEEAKEKVARKIILWAITAAVEAVSVLDIFFTWTLKSLHSYFKSNKKNLALIMIIIALCMDLFSIVSVSLFSGLDWIADIILGVTMFILDLRAGKEK